MVFLKTLCLTSPQSTTYLTPVIVTDVSAIFVLKITFRLLPPICMNTLFCSCGGRLAYRHNTTFSYCFFSKVSFSIINFCVSSISSWPGKKAKISPAGSNKIIYRTAFITDVYTLGLLKHLSTYHIVCLLLDCVVNLYWKCSTLY